MKKIYIVLTFTGTILSRIIRFYTRKEYGHVSVALDRDLKDLYSFGRKNPYNVFNGGFVREGITFGTFKRFRNTTCNITSLEVTDEQYYKLKRVIKNIEKTKQDYKFNVIGLLAVSLNIKLQKEKRFYCAEFVKYVLEQANIVEGLPKIIKPHDFYNLEGSQFVYEGLLRDYPVSR